MKATHIVVMSVFSTLVTMVTISQSQFLPSSFEIFQGFALKDHVIKSLSLFIAECLMVCQDTLECFSINTYKEGNGGRDMCDLNRSTKEHTPKSFVRRVGYQYLQKSDASYLTICSKNPCQHGGECILHGGPYQYVCNCTGGYAGRRCEKQCVVFDFENGLAEWTKTGTAFNNQPTYGDNPQARGKTANHKGNYWIGTIENRPSASHPAGTMVGDIVTGTMTSPKFIIHGTKLKFLIGGGNDFINERVELWIGGKVIANATGAQDETMAEKFFDVTSYRGQIAHLKVIDASAGWWGHINFDHVEDSICEE